MSSAKGSNFFEFIECEDISPPLDYSLDVVRTDSLLSPYVGIIKVDVTERCEVRRAWASQSMSQKKFDALAPSCIGKTYEECIKAGAKPVSKLMASACTGGPGFEFSYAGEVTLVYRWSKGKWEFDEEEIEPPRDPRPDERHLS